MPDRSASRPAGVGDLLDAGLRRRIQLQRRQSRRELFLFVRRLTMLFAAVWTLVAAGTVAYSLTEGSSLGYGFLWTLDTITTLGTIPDPRDTGGRVVTVGLELLGIGTLFYGLATVAEFFVSGQLSGLLDERRAQKMIDSFTNHFIVCGFGRVGRQVVRDLRENGSRFVVIDEHHDHRELAEQLEVPYIEGAAADDEILQQAGIDRAVAVIACVDSDADNIFITLSARELRADILIVARASAEDSEKKLIRAGADRVVSPYKTSGAEMARVALHPQVSGVFQVADYRMEEILVSPDCEGVGKRIEQIRGSSVIVVLRRADGTIEAQPSPQSVLQAGDKLVALGTPFALSALEALFQPAVVGSA